MERGDEMKRKLLAKAKELNKKLSRAEEEARAARAEGARHTAALSDKLRSAAAPLGLELALTNGDAAVEDDNGDDGAERSLRTDVLVEAVEQVLIVSILISYLFSWTPNYGPAWQKLGIVGISNS